jgi:hypothetical protein
MKEVVENIKELKRLLDTIRIERDNYSNEEMVNIFDEAQKFRASKRGYRDKEVEKGEECAK